MHRSALEKRVSEIFARVNPDGITEEEIARLGKDIESLGQGVLPVLLSYMNHLDENLRALAGMVLIVLSKNELREGVKEALFQILENPNCPKEEKYNAISFLACIQGYEIDYDRLLDSVIKPEMLQKRVQGILEEVTRGEGLDRWRAELDEMPMDSKLFCLKYLLDRRTLQVLPLLSAAVDLRIREVSLMLAEGLRDIPFQETLELLGRLVWDKDPLVRCKARETLSHFARQRVDISSIFLLSPQ